MLLEPEIYAQPGVPIAQYASFGWNILNHLFNLIVVEINKYLKV